MSSPTHTEIAVVGAGPAGLAAAVAAAEQGGQVVVLDSGSQPGGQFWRHPDESAHPGYAGAGQHDWRTYRDLRARFDAARARGTVSYRPGRQVWSMARHGSGFEIRTVADVGPASAGTDLLVADRVVLCTGAYDRQLPVPGWDLPGVMSAGGIQALVKANGFAPCRRVVLAGTGPFLLPVADSVVQAGATVVAVCEAAAPTRWIRRIGGAARVPAKLGEVAGYAATFLRHRIPLRTRTVVTEVLGGDRVTGVRLATVDHEGRVLRRRAVHDVDAVGFGWGFTPQLELAVALGVRTRIDADGSAVAVVDACQRSDVPGFFLAGEVTGVGGAQLAVAEGTVAGAAAAGRHAVPSALARTIRSHRAFAAAMHGAHPVPSAWESWLAADTPVCRCEEVPYSAVTEARSGIGTTDARQLKSFTRVGMGWCQGRVCGFAAGCLATGTTGERAGRAAESALRRPLATPVSLGDLAELPDDQPGAT